MVQKQQRLENGLKDDGKRLKCFLKINRICWEVIRIVFLRIYFPHEFIFPRIYFPTNLFSLRICFPHGFIFPTDLFPHGFGSPRIWFPTDLFPHGFIFPTDLFSPRICFPHGFVSLGYFSQNPLLTFFSNKRDAYQL